MYFYGLLAFGVQSAVTALAITNCNLRGTLTGTNPNNYKCKCDPGWTGTVCNQLDLTPLSNIDNSYYNQSLYDPYPTWGARCIVGYLDKDKVEYCAASTFPNRLGNPGWTLSSTFGLWKSVNNGKFTFLSFVGDPNNFLWLHNADLYIQCKPNDQCALILYAIVKRKITGKAWEKTLFDIPNSYDNKGQHSSFTQAGYTQESAMAVMPLQATNVTTRFKEISGILEKFQLYRNVGSTNKSIPINTEFRFFNLSAKLPGVAINTVNGNAPRSIMNDSVAFLTGPNNQLYTLFVLRQRNKKGKEELVLFYSDAYKFPNEIGRFNRSHIVNDPQNNIEDQSCFVNTHNSVQCLLHSFRTCGQNDKQGCVASIYFDLNNPAHRSIFDPSAAAAAIWSKPLITIDRAIPNLERPYSLQRAHVRHENGSLVGVRAAVMFNGYAKQTPNGLAWVGKRGPSMNMGFRTRPAIN